MNNIIIEGLDNSGKNTYVAKHYQGIPIVEFPIRDGLWSKEISNFLAGEIPYGPHVEKWFLENRLEWYTEYQSKKHQQQQVIIRSGISYLVYKWFRTGIEPTIKELERESKLLKSSKVIFLDTEYKSPPEKKEIYDNLQNKDREKLTKMFKWVIEKLISF